VNSLEAYRLRMALIAAGHIPVPCREGRPVHVPNTIPSESAVRGWANLYDGADQTGIYRNGNVTIVEAVPPSASQKRRDKRRAAGMMQRSEWLELHKDPPWAGSGKSKSAWYRAKKREGSG
jgi:hypothetical protein